MVPLTLLTGKVPDASTFRVFGCAVFAKAPNNLRRKLGLKAFRGVMVGYLHHSPRYRMYNPATKRITTHFHVKVQEHVPGFGKSHLVDLSIDVFFDAGDDMTIPVSPSSVEPNNVDFHDAPAPLHDVDIPSRLRGPPTRFGNYVARVSTVPRLCATNQCSLGMSKESRMYRTLWLSLTSP
jgi:hypothetical protein